MYCCESCMSAHSLATASKGVLMRYLICAMPRSGSGYLCELLSATQVAGKPQEYIGDYKPVCMETWHEIEATLSVNGVFGWKTMSWSLAHLDEMLETECCTLAELLRELFDGRIVYLTRRDKVAQAVSFLRFQREGRASSLDAPSPLTDYCYSDAWLDFMITTLGYLESQWERLFAEIGCEPFRIAYEEFDAEDKREGLVARILSFLGVSEPEPLFTGELRRRRIRDGLNAVWHDRYMAGFPFETYAEWTEFINTFHRIPRVAGPSKYQRDTGIYTDAGGADYV